MNIYRLTGYPLSTPADQNSNDLHALLSPATWCTGAPWASSGKLVGYSMSMSSDFAQFAMCDFIKSTGEYSCKGNLPDERSVGRCYAGKTCLRPGMCGQCGTYPQAEKMMGEWYSFPKAGMCNNVPVGTHGCTWKVNSVQVKDVSCIIQRTDVLSKCKVGMTNPVVWAQLNATFMAAMANEADGGCPSVSPNIVLFA